jgi:hypothetical protein
LGVWYYCNRRWLEIGPAGFTISDYRGVRAFRDEDVTEYRCSYHRRNQPSCVARLRVMASGRSERITLRFELPWDEADPMHGFLKRLAARGERRGKKGTIQEIRG